ncbi:MAG: sulfatase-like hydrolase/transferase [Proteobacteria bacterium]|nr:sulfatase-like hydrolase/transferase [Pseudomonadota bacterium]
MVSLMGFLFSQSSDGKKGANQALIILAISLGFAVLTVLQRILIHRLIATDVLDVYGLLMELVSLPGHFLSAVLPAFMIATTRRTGSLMGGFLLFFLLVIFNAFAFHFEVVVGVLPALDAFAYAGEWEHIRSSVLRKGLVIAVIIEVIAILAGILLIHLQVKKVSLVHTGRQWLIVLIAMIGVALALQASNGYATAYFHGGSLDFERQRPFLKMLGFSELHELDLKSDTPVYGWGYADEEVFRQMRSWIETHKKTVGEKPYFTTILTLSTHHPFILPPNWENAVQGPGQLAYKDDWDLIRIYSKPALRG